MFYITRAQSALPFTMLDLLWSDVFGHNYGYKNGYFSYITVAIVETRLRMSMQLHRILSCMGDRS